MLMYTQVNDEPSTVVTYKPVNPASIPTGANNQWVSQLTYNFTKPAKKTVRLTLTNAKNPDQYKVSDDLLPRPADATLLSTLKNETKLSINSDHFSFTFKDKNDKEILSTEKRKFAISDKFSEIGFRLPTRRLYGLGQRNGEFLLKNGTYSLWSQGLLNAIPEDEQLGGTNGNHIHPFVLYQTKDLEFAGIFFVGTSG